LHDGWTPRAPGPPTMRRGGEEQKVERKAQAEAKASASSRPTAESGLPTHPSELPPPWGRRSRGRATDRPGAAQPDGAYYLAGPLRVSTMAPSTCFDGAGGALPSARSDGAGVEGLVLLHAVQAYHSIQQPGSTAGFSAPLAQSSAGATGRPRDAGRGAARFQPEASGSWADRERTQRV